MKSWAERIGPNWQSSTTPIRGSFGNSLPAKHAELQRWNPLKLSGVGSLRVTPNGRLT
jgi:hypothetical protein